MSYVQYGSPSRPYYNAWTLESLQWLADDLMAGLGPHAIAAKHGKPLSTLKQNLTRLAALLGFKHDPRKLLSIQLATELTYRAHPELKLEGEMHEANIDFVCNFVADESSVGDHSICKYAW